MTSKAADHSDALIAELERALEQAAQLNRELESRVEEKDRELQRAVETLKQQARFTRQQTTVGVLAEHESFEEASRQLLASLCATLGLPAAVLWRVDEHARVLRCQEVWAEQEVEAPRFMMTMRTMVVARGTGLSGIAWERGASAAASELEGDASPTASGLFASCAFPVNLRGEIFAVVEFFATTPSDVGEEMLETLDGIGVQLGQALERRFAQRDLRARDLDVARRIQTSILPRTLSVEGFEIVAAMNPAEEVGGDYYDILPSPDGFWLGIGDVSGHGLAAGLVMLMVQSGVAALVGGSPSGAPASYVHALNRMLFENVRTRLRASDFVTFMLARFTQDGRLVMAGAHEDVLVVRAAGGPAERHRGAGTWLALIPDVAKLTTETEVELARGDIAVFYTDGVTEARNGAKDQFGLDRLAAIVESKRHAHPAEIADQIFRELIEWRARQDDDETIAIVRRV